MNSNARLCVITGVTGGVGEAVLRNCIEEEAAGQYIVFYRDREKFEKLSEALNYKKIAGIQFDMANDILPEDINRINADEVDEICLVLCAFTIEPISFIKDLKLDQMKKNVQINVLGQIKIIQYVQKIAEQLEAGIKIINLDSGAAYRPIAGWGAYCASKAYMNMYLQCMAEEEHYSLVLYDPGVVDTGMQKYIRKSEFPLQEKFEDYYTNGMLNSPDLVGKDIVKRYIVYWRAEDLKERYLNH